MLKAAASFMFNCDDSLYNIEDAVPSMMQCDQFQTECAVSCKYIKASKNHTNKHYAIITPS